MSVFVITALSCAVLDLASKTIVAAWVESSGGSVVVVPGWCQFISRLNHGGMWSIGGSMGATTNGVLACVSLLVALGIVAWAWFGLRRDERLSGFVLGAILGGALGNLFDRFAFGGVRDFIDVHYFEAYHYPTFNLADSFLVCATVYLVGTALFARTDGDSALNAESVSADTQS